METKDHVLNDAARMLRRAARNLDVLAWRMNEPKVLKCDGSKTCKQIITMIDKRGFIYCSLHGLQRKNSGESCRRLRRHELSALRRGDTIKRY